MPPYGGSIAQTVYYADSDLCDPNVDTTKGYPSRPKKGGKMEPWSSPYILMVDRGGCTFVKKVSRGLRKIVVENEYAFLTIFSVRSATRNVQVLPV